MSALDFWFNFFRPKGRSAIQPARTFLVLNVLLVTCSFVIFQGGFKLKHKLYVIIIG